MCVVHDIGAPKLSVTWIAMLNGATIAPPEFFQQAGNGDICTVYERALSTARNIWISPRFVQEHRQLVDILLRFFAKPKCAWPVIPSLEEFVSRQRLQVRNRSRHVALVTEADKRLVLALCSLKFACLDLEFVEAVARVKQSMCREFFAARR